MMRVFINAQPEDALTMHVASDGTCYFPPLASAATTTTTSSPSTTPPPPLPASGRKLQPDSATLSILKLELGRNEVVAS